MNSRKILKCFKNSCVPWCAFHFPPPHSTSVIAALNQHSTRRLFLSAVVTLAMTTEQPAPSPGREAEALLKGILSAAKAALAPRGLDTLVWGAARLGDQATLRYLLSNGGGTSWTYPMDGCDYPRRGSSCLWAASRDGHVGIVKELLDSGVEVDEETQNRSEYGSTALCVAAIEGHEGVVEQLLKAGADVDKPRTFDKATPLFVAASQGHEGVVEQLLNAGAEVDKPMSHGGIAYVGATPLHAAAAIGKEGVVTKLLKAGADVNRPCTGFGATPLHEAAENGNEDVVEVVLKAGADPNATADDGTTPLYKAAHYGQEGVVEKLLNVGAEVDNPRTFDGTTPLHAAAEIGHKGVVTKLLQAGADVNRPCTDGGATPLQTAAEYGNEDVVEVLLKAGADPNATKDDGATPLIQAAEEGHSRVCSILLKARANVNHVAADERTALKAAVTWSHRDKQVYREISLMLVEHGATCSSAILGPGQLKRLAGWMAEALREKIKAMEEKGVQMERLEQGIPEWCAQAASSARASSEGQQQGGNSTITDPLQPDALGVVGRKRKHEAPAAVGE